MDGLRVVILACSDVTQPAVSGLDKLENGCISLPSLDTVIEREDLAAIGARVSGRITSYFTDLYRNSASTAESAKSARAAGCAGYDADRGRDTIVNAKVCKCRCWAGSSLRRRQLPSASPFSHDAHLTREAGSVRALPEPGALMRCRTHCTCVDALTFPCLANLAEENPYAEQLCSLYVLDVEDGVHGGCRTCELRPS